MGVTMSEPVGQDITFKYIFADDYNPEYANGVLGGPTARGEIVMHFYQERHAIPRETRHAIDAQGHLGEALQRSPEPDGGGAMAVRVIRCGVTMSLAHARELRAWLDQIIQGMEQTGDAE